MKFLLDATAKGFTPWWKREKDFDLFARRILRLERALKFCVGRAIDSREPLRKHIKFLKREFIKRFST